MGKDHVGQRLEDVAAAEAIVSKAIVVHASLPVCPIVKNKVIPHIRFVRVRKKEFLDGGRALKGIVVTAKQVDVTLGDPCCQYLFDSIQRALYGAVFAPCHSNVFLYKIGIGDVLYRSKFFRICFFVQVYINIRVLTTQALYQAE